MIIQIVRDGEVILEVNSEDYHCLASRGLVSMNEACGGCPGCIIRQASFYGYEIKEKINE